MPMRILRCRGLSRSGGDVDSSPSSLFGPILHILSRPIMGYRVTSTSPRHIVDSNVEQFRRANITLGIATPAKSWMWLDMTVLFFPRPAVTFHSLRAGIGEPSSKKCLAMQLSYLTCQQVENRAGLLAISPGGTKNLKSS
jgi:hypothetical protein